MQQATRSHLLEPLLDLRFKLCSIIAHMFDNRTKQF